jgi:hypothetical protein
MNLLDAKRKLLPLSGYMGMGGGGGGGQQQSSATNYTTNIPEYAKPYVETMLGATQKQLFQGTPTEGGGFDITGFQPYKAYGGTYDTEGNQTSYDPSKAIAGFQPLQTSAQQGIANMQTPEQYGQAMGLTGQGIMGQLGTAGQGVGLSGMGYQAAGTGDRYAQQATNPNAMQAYMSPYMQNVVDVQQREAQRQADIARTGRNAQAVKSGAFGGSRQAITDAEAERNLALQKGDIQSTGLQSAFQQAQQAQQYGANLGLQGMQAGMQGVGAGIGAQQAGYGQAMSGAQNLANLGQQQLGAQQGIYSLQNTTGAQQQALEQQKINQAMQDYANAQQYPLMQLGTMSNMLRGLPMQAQTTQQYTAAPNPVTQAIGAAGAGASLYNAFKAEGGIIKEYAKGGIMSYDVGGEVESDLQNMDNASLEKQLKESTSPSVKRMAQRILRERQMERGPGMAGGGIVAFKEGDEVKAPVEEKPVEPPPLTASQILQQRVMQGKPTGDVMTEPAGITQAAPPPPAQPPAPPPTPVQAAQQAQNIPPVLQSMITEQKERAGRTTEDLMQEREDAYKKYGVADRSPEEKSKLMQERANLEDEAKRQRYMRLAEFFGRWGSTPGATLVAGLNSVKETIPTLIADEKEAKKLRMEIDKSIAALDESTRLDKRGKVDAAMAIREKEADKMQTLLLKATEIAAQAEKDAKAVEAQTARDKAQFEQRTKESEIQLSGTKYVADMNLRGDEIRAKSAAADRALNRNNADEAKKYSQFQTSADQERRVLSDISREESGKAHQGDIAIIKQYSMLPPEQLDKNPQIKDQLDQARANIEKREKEWNSQIENAKRNTDLAYSRAMGGQGDKGGKDNKGGNKRPDLSTFQK